MRMVNVATLNFLNNKNNRKWAESRCGSRNMAALVEYCESLGGDPQEARDAWEASARRKAANRRRARQYSRR